MRAHAPKLLALAIAASFSAPSFGQALEEVLVTAQKRVQSLRDVPISVNAVSGEKIENAGITNIEKLGDYIPSFNMTQTGIGTNIAIRGISSGVNQGFEQSAAQFVDSIHFGRSQLSRAPFLDLERVEVLRGPQSILFGKNSTAGAISITTAKPGNEFEAKLSALYEPEHGERDLRLVVSSPLSDTLGLRVAILDSELDGYMENTTLNRDESHDTNRVVRGTLVWKPDELWDITLKMETGSFDSNGRNIEVIKPVYNEQILDSNGNPPPGAIPYANMLALLTQGNYLLDTTHDFKRQSNGDYSYNNTENITLTIERTLGEHRFTSVTGYNAYDFEELCDCDFTGAPGFNILSMEDYSQFSQEFRIASPEDQTFSYLGGAFFQTADLDFHDEIRVPTNSVIPTALVSSVGSAANLLRGASTQRNFAQTTDIYAIFAQATWNITDQFRTILGARYTYEDKSANRHLYYVTSDGQALPQGSASDPYNSLWRIFRIDPHNIKGDRNESAFTPLVTIQYDLNDTDMVYISYTTGFKSGGFDVRANAAPNALDGLYPELDGTWEFEDEEVTNIEIGGKFVLAEGAAEINAALFRSEFTNMQTSQFDGSLSFIVTNAGEAVVQGLEVDGRWALTDSVLLRGGFAYIDFEYTKFPNSQCYFGQVDNIAPLGDGICDATGKRREFTPEWQGNAGIDYTINFSNGLKLVNTLDVIYSDSYLTTPSLDPRLVQDAFTKLNARIALSGDNDMWELALIGKNLTDESVITYANGLPVASVLTQGASSGFYAFYERPRSVALQGTIRF
ncbi:TonB-dependent receptor [Cellvibrio japonicus]|uniref:Putative TonB-dependent receptor n=1 Tax=Cellvibrio japonicus (strain Ueda107) TaxID=498211 RepID=B3PLA5_CELJU|nr:TonB-dependent receptor [Cellvibrio japonicus]ACE82733.1 putative TonB-dependent receptor [Cellvibrio japonicus Ueda107]QEI11563.1 TonB-dependent receptor [Cellvibrio japonicus]QEI15137.1 TonB-dependent receptor [Cellvibrio japonicus]QEI18717.1 TonB-dependent receptor [Cellvibrio japonicus]